MSDNLKSHLYMFGTDNIQVTPSDDTVCRNLYVAQCIHSCFDAYTGFDLDFKMYPA